MCLRPGHDIGRRRLQWHAVEAMVLHLRGMVMVSIVNVWLRLWLLKAPVAHHMLLRQCRLLKAMGIRLYRSDGPSEI